MNEHETHEGVVKLARRELEDHERINCWFRPEFVRALIDRLEAAHKRERGDCAKMREALNESRRIASDLGGCRLNDYWKLNEIVRVCDAALDTTSKQNTQEEN